MSKIIFNGVDYAGGSGNYFNPVIYSDVERKIGVWRDNKPLYQKTVYYSGGVNGNVTFSHGISDIDNIVSASGIAKDTDTVGEFIDFARIRSDGLNIGFSDITTTNVMYYVPSQFGSRIVDVYVTLRYTKTTDVAGSGDYNTYGVPTVHYDTNEQVIGTWLGKPLYQKVFTGLSVVLGSDWVNAIDITSMYMENCTLGIGIVSNTYQTPLCTRINGNYLQAYMNGMGGVTITTIVIQYTKTTD